MPLMIMTINEWKGEGEKPYPEYEPQSTTVQHVMAAIKDPTKKEIYWSVVDGRLFEPNGNCPDIGFVFENGVYITHGIGPFGGETGYLADALAEANRTPPDGWEAFFTRLENHVTALANPRNVQNAWFSDDGGTPMFLRDSPHKESNFGRDYYDTLMAFYHKVSVSS